jgi:transcriptional regulator with XRE-family HTH domain
MPTIRMLRQARGWSQYELARRIGVHPQAVYLWEHGRRTPQVAQMRKLGGVFELCSDAIALVPSGATEAHQDHEPESAPLPADPRAGA